MRKGYRIRNKNMNKDLSFETRDVIFFISLVEAHRSSFLYLIKLNSFALLLNINELRLIFEYDIFMKTRNVIK